MKWRGLLVGDNHGGSYWGLTPPSWQVEEPHEIGRLQRELWNWWEATVADIGPVDDLIHGGDGIEGPGHKDALDIMRNNLEEQAQLGAAAFEIVERKHTYMVRGTPYHVTTDKDWENEMAGLMGAEIEDEHRLKVFGKRIHTRHMCGNSQTPYGHATQVKKEAVNDMLRGAMEEYEWAQLLLRWHVHQYTAVDSIHQLAMSLPCLKLPYDRFGRKLRTINYHVGVVLFEIFDNGSWIWEKRILEPKNSKPVRYIKLK